MTCNIFTVFNFVVPGDNDNKDLFYKGPRLEMNQGCHKHSMLNPLGHQDGLIMFSFNKKEYSCSTPEKSKAQAKSAEDV